MFFGRKADNVLRDLSHAGAWGQCVYSENKTAQQLCMIFFFCQVYCSVQDDVCHESQLQVDFWSLLGCQCDDEDECVVLEE